MRPLFFIFNVGGVLQFHFMNNCSLSLLLLYFYFQIHVSLYEFSEGGS